MRLLTAYTYSKPGDMAGSSFEYTGTHIIPGIWDLAKHPYTPFLTASKGTEYFIRLLHPIIDSTVFVLLQFLGGLTAGSCIVPGQSPAHPCSAWRIGQD